MPPGTLEFRPTADCHCHFRDGDMMELIGPKIKEGGCDTVYVCHGKYLNPSLKYTPIESLSRPLLQVQMTNAS
jgi:hypothetical protein